MTSIFGGCPDVVDGIRRQFPETGDTILALAALSSCTDGPVRSASCFDAVGHEPVEPDLSPEGISRALEDIRRGFDLPGRNRVAMDFRGHYSESPMFCDYERIIDTRPCLDCVLVVSEDGDIPLGMRPLPERTVDMHTVCGCLKDFDGTYVTDRMYYDRRDVAALDRWGTDWLLIQPPFPGSASTTNAKMSSLTHGGREYETCKARFDKHWLFRFTDVAEKREITGRIPMFMEDRHDEDALRRGAGITDALSSQSFDIRAVRRLIDTRAAWNRTMRSLWNLLPEDSPRDRGEAFSVLCIRVLGLTVAGLRRPPRTPA